MMISTPVRLLEGADVAALLADDAPLHVVGRELDDRDRRLGRVARGDALERVGDEVARAALRLDARLFLLLPDPARELVADQLLGAAEQVRASPPRPSCPAMCWSSATSRSRVCLISSCSCLDVGLAVGDALLAPLELGQPALELLFARVCSLFGLDHARAVAVQLTLDLGAQPHGVFPGGDLRFAPSRLGVALGLIEQQLAVLLRRADRGRCRAA